MFGDKQIFEGPYEIEALGRILISACGTDCHIRTSGIDSQLQLESESLATMSCGSALLSMSALPEPGQGQISFWTGPTGSIVQEVGPSGMGGPALKLEPGMITLSVGPPGAGASISLTPLSVEIKIGTTCLTLTPEGITESGLMKKSDVQTLQSASGGAITQIKGGIVQIN